MDIRTILQISASAMQAQNTRLKVIAENLANADTTASTPGGLPYQRKVVSFRNEFDRALDAYRVEADAVRRDTSDFGRRYEPGHPAADADGYVLTPNVRSLIEVSDMRQAQRSYEANLTVIESTRSILTRVLDLLRG